MSTKIHKLGFDVVNGCQLRCIGCPNSTIKPKIKFISVKDFNICLANLDVDKIEVFRFFNFGEALLHPDIVELVFQISRQSWYTDIVEISTNAQYFNKNIMIELFKLNILTTLSVSCDGNGTPDEYEKYRPPAKWEKLMTFLEEVSLIKNKYSPNVKLQVKSVCDEEDGQKRWLSILKPLGWKPFFRKWMNLPMSISTPSNRAILPFKGVCSFVCNRNNFYVSQDGMVVPCCVHPRASDLGNLKYQKYSQIINGDKRIKFIEELKTNRVNMEICGKCEIK